MSGVGEYAHFLQSYEASILTAMDKNRCDEPVGFFFLLIVVEILLRSVWTVRSCIKFECDFSQIASLKVQNIDRATYIGWTRFDALLGYVPREGFSATMNAFPWHGGKPHNTKGRIPLKWF